MLDLHNFIGWEKVSLVFCKTFNMISSLNQQRLLFKNIPSGYGPHLEIRGAG